MAAIGSCAEFGSDAGFGSGYICHGAFAENYESICGNIDCAVHTVHAFSTFGELIGENWDLTQPIRRGIHVVLTRGARPLVAWPDIRYCSGTVLLGENNNFLHYVIKADCAVHTVHAFSTFSELIGENWDLTQPIRRGIHVVLTRGARPLVAWPDIRYCSGTVLVGENNNFLHYVVKADCAVHTVHAFSTFGELIGENWDLTQPIRRGIHVVLTRGARPLVACWMGHVKTMCVVCPDFPSTPVPRHAYRPSSSDYRCTSIRPSFL